MIATTGAITPPFLTGALGVQIQHELGDNTAALGFAISAFFITAGVMSIPLGRMADRIGWGAAFRFGASASVLSLLGVAAYARSWVLLTLLLLVGGFGHALVMPASNLALAREFGPRRRGLLFGVKQSASPAATFLGGAAVPLLALTVGWRWAFVVAAVVPMLSSGLVPPVGDRAGGVVPTRAGRGHVATMVRLAVAGGFGAAVVTALSAFLVVAVVAGGVSEAGGGQLLAIGSVISLIARVSAGWIADRRRHVGFIPIAALLTVGGVAYITMAATTGAVLVAAALVAFAAGAGWPGLFHLAVVHHNEQRAASATGIIQAGLSTGAALGPLTYGTIAHATSFGTAWLVMGLVAMSAAALILRAGRALEVHSATNQSPPDVDPAGLRR
jgi:MFS family permease